MHGVCVRMQCPRSLRLWCVLDVAATWAAFPSIPAQLVIDLTECVAVSGVRIASTGNPTDVSAWTLQASAALQVGGREGARCWCTSRVHA